MAQIEISAKRVLIHSEPAAAISPAIVNMSGRPGANNEPEASTRMASVTGQEMTSDFSLAHLFASLKSDQVPAAPVRLTSTPSRPRPASRPFNTPAARTISFESRAAPARITAVWGVGGGEGA